MNRLRSLGVGLLLVAAFALALARLRRVARPRFVAERSFAGGVASLGRVELGRPGERGDTIGRAIVCRGREVFSALGGTSLDLVDARADELRLRVRPRSGEARALTVSLPSCRVRWHAVAW